MIALDRKRLIIWALLTVASVVVLAACSSSETPTVSSSSSLPKPVTVGVAPVTTGAISVTTAYAAIAEAKELVDVVPVGEGRLEKLLVDVGSEVKEGQIIAELSHGTFDAQLDQALASLRGAEVNLASVQAGIKLEQTTSQAEFDAALAALNQLRDPSDFALQVAQSAVVEARSNLNSKKTKLDQFLNPSASDLQAQESAVATALSNLDSANTKLAQLLDPSASDIRAAESDLATAVSNLDSASTSLDQVLNPTAADSAAAQEAVANAQSKLSTAESTVNQAITDELAKVSITPELEDAWEAVLDARVREQANTATLLNPSLRSGLSSAELAKAQEDVIAYQDVISTQLALITSTSLVPADINTAMLAETSADTALDTTNEELKELQNPSESTISVARNNVAILEAEEESAIAALDELQNADSRSITAAQSEVAKAQAALDAARATRTERLDPSQTAAVLAQYDVDAAQASFDTALANLDLLTDPQPADLAAAEAAAASAQQTLAMSNSGFQVDTAEVAVDEAQAQVDLIRQQLSDLQLRAPFDGLVTRKILAPGAFAADDTPIVTVASTNVIVFLRVEETSISSLREGQSVIFTSPALPGKDLELQIDRIAPAGDEKTYTFLVQLNSTGPIPDLKPGMSGQVSIMTHHENAVLVPKEAVLRHLGRPALFVIQNNKALLRTVDVGLNDLTNIEIFGGIQPGDKVVISGHNVLEDGDEVSIMESPRIVTSTG